MFDLITGTATHIPRNPRGPILVSTGIQLGLMGLIVVVPVLLVTHALPEPPTMMAFVAAPPPPPPPPPPPAPAPLAKKAEPVTAAPTVGQFAAPVEAPAAIAPAPAGEDAVGVEGGVEGGVPGGVVGGVVGGLPDAPPPPPPPPPAPTVTKAPVRIGGQIQPPTLIRRVEPTYPPMAVNAHVQGIVILEAIVDEEGRVKEVKVLRSANLMLDQEAMAAVRQWRYAPVVLNGTPVRFVLSVALSFTLQDKG